MLQELGFISESDLTAWVKSHLSSAANDLSAGYQGKTLLFQQGDHKLVIKAPLGNFLTRPINLALLRHEYRIYEKLAGMHAIPVCYGMANNEFLVLEFIEGKTMREYRPDLNSGFYEKLFTAIEQMHCHQVAHFDLKRKENLLVTADNEPKIIDFGVSVCRKEGVHFLNQFLFKLAKQFDYNAWIRHKYNRKFETLSEADKPFYKKTRTEVISLKLKDLYKKYIRHYYKK